MKKTRIVDSFLFSIMQDDYRLGSLDLFGFLQWDICCCYPADHSVLGGDGWSLAGFYRMASSGVRGLEDRDVCVD